MKIINKFDRDEKIRKTYGLPNKDLKNATKNINKNKDSFTLNTEYLSRNDNDVYSIING